jgi:hypothetical protein
VLNKLIDEIISEGGLELLNENNWYKAH